MTQPMSPWVSSAEQWIVPWTRLLDEVADDRVELRRRGGSRLSRSRDLLPGEPGLAGLRRCEVGLGEPCSLANFRALSPTSRRAGSSS